MTIQEAYKRFLLKINKNDTDDEVRVSPAEFVFHYNEQSLKWLGNKIATKSLNENIDDLQELLIDVELNDYRETRTHNDFVIPEDFFQFVSAEAISNRDNCERYLYVHNIKPKEKNSWLQDDMNKPSFEWEETISIISGNKIQIYKSDFDVTGLELSYYRKPRIVDIEGYRHIDGKASKTIHPDLKDENVNEIINRIAFAVALDYGNPEKAQNSVQRIVNE